MTILRDNFKLSFINSFKDSVFLTKVHIRAGFTFKFRHYTHIVSCFATLLDGASVNFGLFSRRFSRILCKRVHFTHKKTESVSKS